MIINKDKVDNDLVHDIDLELENLFKSDRTWEINASSEDFLYSDIVQIVVRGKGHCYTGSITDTDVVLWDLLNSNRTHKGYDTFSTGTSYYDPLKEAIVFEYMTYISLEEVNI